MRLYFKLSLCFIYLIFFCITYSRRFDIWKLYSKVSICYLYSKFVQRHFIMTRMFRVKSEKFGQDRNRYCGEEYKSVEVLSDLTRVFPSCSELSELMLLWRGRLRKKENYIYYLFSCEYRCEDHLTIGARFIISTVLFYTIIIIRTIIYLF